MVFCCAIFCPWNLGPQVFGSLIMMFCLFLCVTQSLVELTAQNQSIHELTQADYDDLISYVTNNTEGISVSQF